MYSLLKLKKDIVGALVLCGSIAAGYCATGISRTGSEYRFLPTLPGDQVLAQMSFNSFGGYLIVQDNSIDGNGLGIRYRRYYPDLSASQSTWAVNSFIGGDQQNAAVAALPAGGAAFAWESTTPQGHRIMVRFLNKNDLFTAREVLASVNYSGNETTPAVAALNDGTVVVAWAEENREPYSEDDNSKGLRYQGIYAQRFSSEGERLGETFQVNQISLYDQRTPAIAALANGNFAVAWISDQARYDESVDVYGRIYTAAGQPVASEFRLNNSEKLCANPTLVATPNGFRASWSGSAHQILTDSGALVLSTVNDHGWDAVTRVFDLQGNAGGDEVIVNNTTKGDQFSPKMASIGDRQLIVWTSYGQDGADEGIYGRFVNAANDFYGSEFLVNTRTIGKQIFPAVAAVGAQNFTVVWSSFVGGVASYDLFAQNYTADPNAELAPPTVPFVSALSQSSICVSWAEVLSQPVASYLIYVDDETAPLQTSEGMMTITRPQWQAGSTHNFRIAYKTADGRISTASEAAPVKLWGADLNADGLPDDWQSLNWGKRWPAPDEDSDGDGASNRDEFLAGTDPTDANSVLRLRMSARLQGIYIEWNTQPGSYYQLQVTSDFQTWRNVGTPRFAPSTTDTLPATDAGQVRYYRVIRMR